MGPGLTNGQSAQNELQAALFSHSSDHVALKSSKVHLTYGQLQYAVSKLSTQIRGVLPVSYETGGKCAVLHLPNSVAYVEALLSLVMLDCPFTSVTVATPLAKLEYIMKDVGASVLITTRSILDSGKLNPVKPVVLTSVTDLETPLDEELVILKVEIAGSSDEVQLDQECCYIMYTSGSTGKPKGVQCVKSAAVNMANGQIERFRLSENDVTAQFSPVGFDAVISEVFATFISGGALAVLYDNERVGIDLCRAVRDLEVSVITLPASLLAVYHRSDFPTLKKVISAGEACSRRIGNLWMKEKDVAFFNAYGAAETTVCSLVYEHTAEMVADEDQTGGDSLPIGKALPNVTVSVKDDALNDVPVGVVGEICVGGIGLALGYVGEAEKLTAARFVVDPKNPGQRLYRTGDLGMLLESGDVVFKGRVDEQVKLRGQMINLRGIEETILQCKGVAQATVVVHQVGSSSENIAAFVSPESMSLSTVRDFLQTRHECYEVPALFKMVNSQDLPRNASGKIDKKALSVDDSLILGAGGPSLTDMERRLAKVCCGILNAREEELLSKISSDTSLVEMGIASEKIIFVQDGIKKEFGVNIPGYKIETNLPLEDFVEMIQKALEEAQ